MRAFYVFDWEHKGGIMEHRASEILMQYTIILLFFRLAILRHINKQRYLQNEMKKKTLTKSIQ